MGPVKYSKTPMVPFFLLNLPLGVYLFMTPNIPLQPHKKAFPNFLKFWKYFHQISSISTFKGHD